MEEPTPNNNQEKNINFTLNDKKYNIVFSSSKNDLRISCEVLEINKIFENIFSYETITNINRYFLMYESIIDIMNELYNLIKDNKIDISKDDSNLMIIFKLPNQKFKEANFSLKNKIQMINEEIIILKQKIDEKQLEIDDLKKKIIKFRKL